MKAKLTIVIEIDSAPLSTDSGCTSLDIMSVAGESIAKAAIDGANTSRNPKLVSWECEFMQKVTNITVST